MDITLHMFLFPFLLFPVCLRKRLVLNEGAEVH